MFKFYYVSDMVFLHNIIWTFTYIWNKQNAQDNWEVNDEQRNRKQSIYFQKVYIALQLEKQKKVI